MQKILSTQLIRTVIAILLFLSFARQGVSSPNYAHAVDAREEERLESEMSTSAIDGFSESANAAGPAYLVKDISKGSGYQLGGFTVVGDMLYFMAVKYLSPGCVEELWKSDGSGEGTVLVKRFTRIDDYCPGYPTNQMVGVANTLYFNFNDGIHGDELWKSDGTESGTVMVKDIAPGSVSSFPGNFTDIGGVLYFKAEDDYAFEAPRTGELWKSDGTESGTVQVKDVTPRYLTEFNGAVYFDGESGVADAELWKSDGTEAGTVLVKAINFGRPASLGDFTVINGVLYFGAYTSPWSHLWKSDGTEAGTVGVKSFVGFGHQLELTNFNEVLYLRASHDSSVGDELFMSDGTDIGTILVKDINPTGDASPQNLTVVGNLLYFSASDGTNGEELWKSDGTESGTVMVKDINSGSGDASIEQLTNVGGDLCFIADDGVKGRELWISNGSESGTNLVKDIVTGFEDSNLIQLTNLGGSLVFSSDHQEHKGELWLSDGTNLGTDIVKKLYLNSKDSFFSEIVDADGTLFFITDDGIHGEELWKSDGTLNGTVMVKDVNPDIYGYINDLEAVNNNAYFVTDDGVHGRELWKSDGTAVGTSLVKDIWPGSDSSYPNDLTNVEGTLFFTALRDDGVYGIWKSDGTDAGTVFIAAIDYEMEERTVFKGELFFRASGRFWRSDGTEAGTYLIKDISPYCLTGLGDYLYFAAIYSGAGSEELWKSDGTEAGTSLVKDIVPGNLGSMPYPNEWCELEAVGDQLFFVAGYYSNDSHGGEVWKTDGTESGTVLVKDINPGSGDACTPGEGCNLTDVGGTLFFAPFKEPFGRELWKSDGSATGTVLVKDINPGTEDGFCSHLYSSRCFNLFNASGTLYFDAHDGIDGYELWQSDGTAIGTEMIQDIAPGLYPSGPNSFILSGARLYFVADDSTHGDELWALPFGFLSRIDITGDQQGLTGVTYDFTAQVNPPSASTPVTYEWQATDEAGKTNTGGLSDTVSFTWTSPGTKTISVTASNQVNTVTAEFAIAISEPDVPLSSVVISGAAQGQTGVEYNFLAEVNPLEATLPITYEWLSTDQTVITNTGGVSDSVAFTWSTTGTKTISVTASNKVNAVQAQFDINVGESDIPLGSLILSGDQEGLIGAECIFSAEVGPLGATTPITYEWQATGQNEVINTSGLSDSVKFIWDRPGTKSIFVTARNNVNELFQQIDIEINDVAVEIYIPVLLNK